VCWPLLATLTEMTGIKQRALINTVQRLEACGLIRTEPYGRGQKYHILRAVNGAANAPFNGAPDAPIKRRKRAPDAPVTPRMVHETPRMVQNPITNGAPDAPRTLSITKKEPKTRVHTREEAKPQDLDSGVQEASQQAAPEPEPTADPVAAQQAYADAMRAIRLRNPKRLAAKYPANSVEQQLAATQGPPPPPPELKLNPKLADAVLAARAALAENAARRWQVAA
jgi:hypothetical protein